MQIRVVRNFPRFPGFSDLTDSRDAARYAPLTNALLKCAASLGRRRSCIVFMSD